MRPSRVIVLGSMGYPEQPGRITPPDRIDRCLAELAEAKARFRRTSLMERVRLARACLDGTVRMAEAWVAAACHAKGIPLADSAASEEWATGPLATARYLKLIVRTFQEIQRYGQPRLPGEIATGPVGQLRVQVFPARGLFDRWLFRGWRAHVWMRPGVTRENLADHLATGYRLGAQSEGIALVLGAGNVGGIPATDAFTKLFQERRVVLLKMSPVNEYLGPIFEEAFAALFDAGYLRVIYGGADVGAYALAHESVDEVHITGSVFSHDAIVWGPPGPDRERRRAAGEPRLKKRLTSELGNVTPWIIVPGPYREHELDFQAENLAAMITNNASFNCVAAKMIVTWRGWPDRLKFLDKIDAMLARVPVRRAYYPGALERFRRFTGREPEGVPAGTLPWTLVRDVAPERDPHWFREESFVSVCAETALEAASEEDFLDRVAAFANDELWGTLGAGVMVHPQFRRRAGNEARLWRCVSRLRYGTVAINQWPALAYTMMTTPWGGFPGSSLYDPQSGIGWVHNTYLLDQAEKSVLEGPLTIWPKPFWFPTHRRANQLARKVLRLYHRPAWWKLAGLLPPALLG